VKIEVHLELHSIAEVKAILEAFAHDDKTGKVTTKVEIPKTPPTPQPMALPAAKADTSDVKPQQPLGKKGKHAARECQAEGCTNRFWPKRSDSNYCSDKCQKKASNKRRYAKLKGIIATGGPVTTRKRETVAVAGVEVRDGRLKNEDAA